MERLKDTGYKRFIRSFQKVVSTEIIKLQKCKTAIYRFKDSYRIEVISRYEQNETFFKPYKR